MKKMTILNENTLPVLGGAAGGMFGGFNSSLLDSLPTLETIITTIILGAIGGVAGYLSKKILVDGTKWLWRKIFNKN